MDVFLRYDDYSAKSNTEVEKKLLELIDKYQLPTIFGVVPMIVEDDVHKIGCNNRLSLPKHKIDLLYPHINRGNVKVALHGYDHRLYSKESIGEFGNTPYSVQNSKIKQGKELLESWFNCSINWFIPPWNAYDQNTIKALEENYFQVLSADLYGKVDIGCSLKLMPTTHKFDEINQLDFGNSRYGQVALVMLHDFDFIEKVQGRPRINKKAFENLENLINSEGLVGDWQEWEKNVFDISSYTYNYLVNKLCNELILKNGYDASRKRKKQKLASKLLLRTLLTRYTF